MIFLMNLKLSALFPRFYSLKNSSNAFSVFKIHVNNRYMKFDTSLPDRHKREQHDHNWLGKWRHASRDAKRFARHPGEQIGPWFLASPGPEKQFRGHVPPILGEQVVVSEKMRTGTAAILDTWRPWQGQWVLA